MQPNFPHSFYNAVFAAAVTIAPVAAHAMGDEEFVGPFPSWASVKTNYGAVGAGASGGTMLYLNGIAYSRFDRLTFNGSGLAGNLVDQSWDGTTGNFDTGNEYTDDVFENGVSGTSYGIRCGFLGQGCAE